MSGPAQSPATQTGQRAAQAATQAPALDPAAPLARILDLARWSPSGDNTQPWRFEVLGEGAVRVHAAASAEHGVYDLEGHANQLAVGALLETMRLAASTVGRRMAAPHYRPGAGGASCLEVHFEAAPGIEPEALAASIERRAVQRRSMATRPLSAAQKAQLAAALPEGFGVLWFEGLAARWRMARFAFDNAHIRLTIPEAYEIHRKVIAWGQRYSAERIPEQALGVDALSARFMRWALHSWERIDFLNTYCLGHLLPRLQMDFLPGLRCGAHFALLAPATLQSAQDYHRAGAALQRFWLSLTALGWCMQPQMTPVLFTQYVRRQRSFTCIAQAARRAERLNGELIELIAPHEIGRLFFLGRTGAGPQPSARSLRRPLAELLIAPAATDAEGDRAHAGTRDRAPVCGATDSGRNER
jgi:nitroreductase